MSAFRASVVVSDAPEGVSLTSQALPDGLTDVGVTIAPGLILDAPVRVRIHVAGACRTRVRVRVGEGANVRIAEEATGEGEWTHEVRVEAEAEAIVEYASLQMLESSASVTVRQEADAAAGATMAWRNVTLGGASVRCDAVSRASGADATCGMDWMSFAIGKEKYELTCRNVFDAQRGGGEILMKSVAQDTAHVSCRGMIDIGLQGGGTNTYLTQDVLMLDASAKVDAIPGLEIKTNDVKASHSAVVSRVTPEDLFYFGSRGIAKAEARRLFIEGFLAQIAERMPYVQEAVVAAIARKMDRAAA